jgi:hypothetical protein
MPSLHLDIPSIDWIERAPRGGKPGRGKACPADGDRAPTPDGRLADRAPEREARDPEPGLPGPAGAMA